MIPKPDDRMRLDFLGQFGCHLSHDPDTKLWTVKVGHHYALGKNPRRAIDEAIKWTRQKAG